MSYKEIVSHSVKKYHIKTELVMRKRDAEKLKERRTDINFEIIYSLYFMITSDGTYMCKCFIIVYIE